MKANAPKTSLIVRKEPGGRVYYIFLKFKMPKSGEFKEQSPEFPIQAGNFVQDPRTHLYMQPGPGRGDPAKPTAALLFPMNGQKNFRKGRNEREIWDHIWRILTTRRSMYQEDKDLDSNYASERAALAAEVKIFDAYGSDERPYERLTDIVHWLVWLGRWNQDPEKASGNLESCFKNAWEKKKKGLGVSPLRNAGYLGSHIPTADEVKEARQLLNGLPEGIAGGRWTLADKLFYQKPLGTPYDK